MRGIDLKPHIGIFGRRNTGKSSLINVLTGQDTALVSPTPGTTTDPVRKSMELFGVGPVILIDTAGIDDEGTLGELRTGRTRDVLSRVDAAILVVTGEAYGEWEADWMHHLESSGVPFFVVYNKCDQKAIDSEMYLSIRENTDVPVVEFSALTGYGQDVLLETLRSTLPETSFAQTSLLQGVVGEGDLVLLVTPIDSEAPQGRMILPQVTAIRDVLDHHATCIVAREDQAAEFFQKSRLKPALVITDSQAFAVVRRFVPQDVPLTSFSIAYARMRGPFEAYIDGARGLSGLIDGSRILILESCTHQISCEDIGRIKIPAWIEQHTGKHFEFDFVAGSGTVQRAPVDYSLVIQCGGCMVTRRQVYGRLEPFIEAGIPVTNYGLLIAALNGILDQVIQPFRKNDGTLR